MQYSNILTGIFLARPNRFLARVLVDGRETLCHVRNTGRLKELLVPGTAAAVQYHPDAASSGRKTSFSLIAVQKPSPDGPVWVNIDSQAPNLAAWEWLHAGNDLPFSPVPASIKREVRFGGSRFDLSFTCGEIKWFLEVKGVTLDRNGTAMFPDAPTDRGIRHLEELGTAAESGCGAGILFVIQMKGISSFSPNASAHPEFALALNRARERGVLILARDCIITENSMSIDRSVPVNLPSVPLSAREPEVSV